MSSIIKQADIEQLEAGGLPDNLANSSYELIQRGAAINPNAPALTFFLNGNNHRNTDTWTYQQLLGQITQCANFFHELGANKDTVIAFILPNLPETHFVIWGGQASGIIAAINPLLETEAISDLLDTANAEILVTLAPFPGTDLWPKVQPALAKLPKLKHLVLVNLAGRVQGLKKPIAKLLAKREEWRLHGLAGIAAALPSNIKTHYLQSGLARQPSDHLLSQRIIDPQDYSSYFCTGGTTGLPKIAMRKHCNEVANVWSSAQFLGDGIGPGKNVFCGLPLFHVNAVQVTGLLPFSNGAHVILGSPQGYRGEGVVSNFWDIVEHHRVHFFSGVPTLYAALMQIPTGKHDISSLEFGLCGAAPMPKEVFKNFQERTGLKILEGYGLTEGTCVSSVNPPLGERRLGSIGLRIPGQLMKAVLLNEESGAYLGDCTVDEIGALIISGPNVFAGYTAEEQNRNIWVDTGDGRKWLNTGDLGRQDAEGYFWLTGRKKELIIRGGHNIDPLTIEAPLHQHPAVEIAAAVGRPDQYAGELPVAYVQLKAQQSVTEAELMLFCQNNISERAAQPKFIRIIDAMPLTGVGKIFKPTLKKMEMISVITEQLQDIGIDLRDISINDEKLRGTVIRISLVDSTAQAQAKEILGHYSMTIEFN